MSEKTFKATNKEEALFRCPSCGSRKIARIQWGRPEWSDGFKEKLDSGKLTLGSCFVDRRAPKWKCLDCWHTFGQSDIWSVEFTLRHEPIPDYVEAHSHCSFNQEELANSKQCACFGCQTIFCPDEIDEWIDDSDGYTAVCPLCGKDAIIGDASGYPIMQDFIEQMNHYWMNNSDSEGQ